MVFLLRALRRISQNTSWLLPAGVAAFVFLSGWLLMALVEPGSALVQPESYWWWYLVTSATVGYGDLFPETAAGRVVGGYVIVGGIVTLTIIFARVAGAIESTRGRRMQGLGEYHGDGQVVLLGYTAGRTERLVRGIVADGEREVVLCAFEDQVAEHPMAAEPRVHLVRGDLTEMGVLERAGLSRAAAVLVDARDDNEAIALTVAAEHAAPGVHTVVALRDLGQRRTVRRIDDTVDCVQWHSVQLIVEELQDPGLARVYQELMDNRGTGTFSTTVPDDGRELSYGEWQQALGRAHGITVLAVARDGQVSVSPAWETPVPSGSVLYYVAGRRFSSAQLAAALRG